MQAHAPASEFLDSAGDLDVVACLNSSTLVEVGGGVSSQASVVCHTQHGLNRHPVSNKADGEDGHLRQPPDFTHMPRMSVSAVENMTVHMQSHTSHTGTQNMLLIKMF